MFFSRSKKKMGIMSANRVDEGVEMFYAATTLEDEDAALNVIHSSMCRLVDLIGEKKVEELYDQVSGNARRAMIRAIVKYRSPQLFKIFPHLERMKPVDLVEKGKELDTKYI